MILYSANTGEFLIRREKEVDGALCKSLDCALKPGKNGRKSRVYTSLLSILSPFLTHGGCRTDFCIWLDDVEDR
uniref:Uncharacterized protein n=1 Tax=Candidatus Kentrum sp. DK TaxID=2126562 RepID=A0A450RV89_9GAMM|nr:MAG: hypothetical protein BECKDK2373B_GA0170837_100364 [Candidatus Kentron sp. DK]